MGRILLGRGQLQAAITAFAAETNPVWLGLGRPLSYYAQGRRDEARAATVDLQSDESAAFQVGEAYAYGGDADQAFFWLNKAVATDPGIQWELGDPLLEGITGDGRYATLLARLKLPQ